MEEVITRDISILSGNDKIIERVLILRYNLESLKQY